MRGLTGRYTAAMALVAAVVLALTGVLLYFHSTHWLGDAAFDWGVLGLVAVIVGAAIVLFLSLAQSFVQPLHAAARALADAAHGNYDTVASFGDAEELKELSAAVEKMRTSLRSSTVSRDYLDRLLANMGEALLITDVRGKIERANAAAEDMFGYRASDLIGKLAHELIVSNDRRQANGPASRPREGFVQRPDGSKISISYTESEVRNDRDALEGKVYAARNVDERKRVEQRIRYLARTDPLTKIANRMQFQHLLQQGIARARRTQSYLAITDDPLIGARKEFLDPTEMALFNSNVSKVLAITGVYRIVQTEIDKVIYALEAGQAAALPKLVIDITVIRDNSVLSNPYARAKAMAAYGLAEKVAEINALACFMEKESEKYIPLVAAAHEIAQAAARLAEEAREIEKYNDSVARKPHAKSGKLKNKTKLMSIPTSEETN